MRVLTDWRTSVLTMLNVIFLAGTASTQTASYPPSPVIAGIEFDMTTLDQRAPGSDDWPVTWAADNNQYTSWGDGGGFGGTNSEGRVSFGFGEVIGPKDQYTTANTWGGQGLPKPGMAGKCYGMLALGDTLYMWRSGDGSDAPPIFRFQELYYSLDKARTWVFTGVRFTPDDFPASHGFFVPTFLQFGSGYEGARDDYVYMYAPEIKNFELWNVQVPGDITMMRVLRSAIMQQARYDFFSGLDQTGNPVWKAEPGLRKPVFSDVHGVMRTSVTYNSGLHRYLLTTQQISRDRDANGHIGIYDAPEPWGPWTTVLFTNPFTIGLVTYYKTVFFNFSNKWTSQDGRSFVMVYTNEDNWATVEGQFRLRGE